MSSTIDPLITTTPYSDGLSGLHILAIIIVIIVSII